MDSVTSDAGQVVERARAAADAWAGLDQAATDRIVAAVFRAAFRHRARLARLSAEETGIGVLEHKIIKNSWASLVVYEYVRPRRTVGLIDEDETTGISTHARPRGPILALTPVTNPTSTVIFKCIICAKTRNPLILSPHGGARKCSIEAARILSEAALEAGAPENCIQWLKHRQREVLEHVMSHRELALILATGTREVVEMAQRSGNPVLGVGPGNVPVFVDEECDLEWAVRSILESKTFDNGVVCASEQALIVTEATDARVRALLRDRGAYFCTQEEAGRLELVVYDRQQRAMAAGVVGRPAAEIAQQAGMKVPESVRLLIAEPYGIGPDEPLSCEILAPVLAYYTVEDLDAAVETAARISRLGGMGHTVGVWSENRDVVQRFVEEVPAGRVCVNQPTTQGALGGLYNFLPPSLTLGTGSGGGNLTTDNITIDHLLTYQRVARRRENRRWLDTPRDVWFDDSIDPEEARRIYNRMW